MVITSNVSCSHLLNICSNLVAFSTSDCAVHICSFDGDDFGLKVKATLQGHNNEVTQVSNSR